uniref:NADH dehydrogenase subunit 1 n=1 Tax=Heligmosomoides polygyrus TaxID=6339 RepID=A0A183GRL8_HELPZ
LFIRLLMLFFNLFVKLMSVVSGIIFFYFMCFSVISRILGIVIIVGCIKFYGDDYCIY